jgi:hypothetical protein
MDKMGRLRQAGNPPVEFLFLGKDVDHAKPICSGDFLGGR